MQYIAGDEIKVYMYQSEELYCQTSSSAVVDRVNVGINQTWVRLNISMPYFDAADLIDDRCQLFWAAYLRQNGQVVHCSCLRAQPNWMWELRDRLQNAKLRKLALPGTHDACAYTKYQGGLAGDNIATRYAVAQGDDLFNQLSFGIRYMDIRILQRAGNEEARFWTNHGAYIFRPLLNDTALVREFLSRTNEIVIFDIHGLDGMDEAPDSHEALQTLLYNEFSLWMAPSNLTWEVTLGQLWAMNKRLIVTYSDASQVGVPYLWTPVQHQWGNVNTVGALQSYLQGVMDSAAAGKLDFPWSSMAELTPTTSDVITDSLGGLRNAAEAVNRKKLSFYNPCFNSIFF